MIAPARIITDTQPADVSIPDDVRDLTRLLAGLWARDIARAAQRQVDASIAAAIAQFRADLLDGGASVREAAAASSVFGDVLAAECQRLAAGRTTRGAA